MKKTKSCNYYDLSRNYPALKHFTSSEFDSPDDEGSGQNMCPKFLQMLDEAREQAGVPFVITSGYRTPKHNTSVGGVKNSSHINIPCNAVDIAVKDGIHRFLILVSLMSVGFTRFGIGKTFIHVDADEPKYCGEKSPNTIWTYY